MLTVFFATLVLFLLVIGGMSLGYLFKRKSLQGSCGGITALGIEKVCHCPEPCETRKKREAKAALRNKQRIFLTETRHAPGVVIWLLTSGENVRLVRRVLIIHHLMFIV